MEYEIWLGSEASYQVVQKYLKQFMGADYVKEAFQRQGYNEESELCPVFGVDRERPGLTILRKIGEQTVMQVAGSLTPNFSFWHRWVRGEVVSYEAIRDALAICQEQGITDVIMHFDTGGGSVRGLSQTSDAMKAFERNGGQIRAHSDAYVASAGYWLMCGAKSATASEMTEIGSIGTMAVVRTLVNTEENMGVKFTVIKAGKYKALGNPFEELTPEIKKRLQDNIDETNDFFLKRVSVERNLMLSETGVWAEGQMFFAEKARQVGLIDRVTTMDDLIGSGPAANTTSVERRFDMKISPEKLAQIEAGADPKVVLSAAELEVYMATLEEANKGDKGEGEGDKTKVEGEPEKDAKEPVKEPAKEPAVEGQGLSMSDELRKALKEVGALETKLEARDAEMAKLKEANDALTKEMDSLMVVAQHTIANQQRVLGKTREVKSKVPEVLQQFNELQARMAEVFPTGKQSSDDPTKDTTTKPGGALSYRLQHAEAPTKTGR